MRLLILPFVWLILFCCFTFNAAAQSELAVPRLTILTPETETVVVGKTTLEFELEGFDLTSLPTNLPNQGVIALYVDGKFYSNTATTSATVQFGKIGTHRVDAELVSTNRRPVLPRVAANISVHNQRKLPYLFISNFRNGTTIYTANPVLKITSQIGQYEDQNSYYQVFVNGVIDGDSTQSENRDSYTLQQPLKEGRNTIRVALYGELGKPYSPVVDHMVEVFYQSGQPVIKSVDVFTDPSGGDPQFEAVLGDFSVPIQGYILAKADNWEESFATTSGTLKNLPKNNGVVSFSLVDIYGFDLAPPVSADKNTLFPAAEVIIEKPRTIFTQGIYDVAEIGSTTRIDLILLAVLQGVSILIFGAILAVRHAKFRHL